MFDHLRSIQRRDPANPTFAEVLFAYNGYHAMLIHRMNNFIWRIGLRAMARFLANIGRIFTGIEIHPEANIGKNVFIDHGTGCVIGQTAIIEDNVTMYHGVTLGGVGRSGQVDGKRHPTLKEGCVVGAGAQVLGNITIGKHAKVGANSVVTMDIPDDATAIGIPARVIGGDDCARAYGMPSHKELAEAMSTMDDIVCEVNRIKAALNLDKADV
jgi:serine O-acetyltransferase